MIKNPFVECLKQFLQTLAQLGLNFLDLTLNLAIWFVFVDSMLCWCKTPRQFVAIFWSDVCSLFFDGFGKNFFWSITLSCFNASVMTSTWSGPERFIEFTLSDISFAKRYFFALFYVLTCGCWFELTLLMSYQEFLNLQNMRKCM